MIWHTLILRAVQRAGAAPRSCPRCGHTVPPGEPACPGCGAALPVPPPLPGPARTERATGWVALAIILLLAGTMVYLAWRDDPPPPGPPAVEAER